MHLFNGRAHFRVTQISLHPFCLKFKLFPFISVFCFFHLYHIFLKYFHEFSIECYNKKVAMHSFKGQQRGKERGEIVHSES